MKKKIVYSEPADFFPKEIRKEFGLGEYFEDPEEEAKKIAKKPTKKAKKKAR